ncbi:MAG TPA: hypothetical protein VKX39_07765 [Bryobacteraceae bacterium]|jgi:peptide methionine sulfoxide reductase MsrA|nr:hypothetical protein [Bryobacteraceae bacterium]
MKTRITLACGILIVMFAGCSRSPEERQQQADDAARQAGRAAYQAAEKAKQAAKEAEKAAEDLNRKLEHAGVEARKGWDEAKRDHQQQPPPQ